jgi:flagellar biosynthetic protein FliR
VLSEVLPVGLFVFLLVFARLGATLMVLPGFGEAFVSPRIRLVLALGVAAAVAPALSVLWPAEPAAPALLLPLLFAEIGIGLLLGLAARLTLSALHVAGTIIAFQSGLGFAQFYDPEQGQQGTIVATFLSLAGITLIFAADLHHVALRAAFDSYRLFPPGGALAAGDFSELALELVSGAFLLGVQIAAPFLVYGLAFYVGLGMLARLMPQLQVFFIAVPAQIMLSFALIAVAFGTIAIWFLEYFENGLAAIIGR